MFSELVPTMNLVNVELSDTYLVGKLGKKCDLSHLEYSKGDQALVGKFAGLNSLFEYQKTRQPNPKHSGSSDGFEGGTFHHFKNFKKAIDVFLKDPQSIAEFDESDRTIEGGEASGKQVVYDVTGDFIDVGRYLEGLPETFGEMTAGNPRNRRVVFWVDLSWVCNTHKDVINYRSKRILRLVDWLESQNIRTAITGIESTQCGHLEVAIKHFDEPLDINDLAVMGHSDFLRRVIFRFDEHSETWEGGYGSPYFLTNGFNPKYYESPYNEEIACFLGGGRAYGEDQIKEAYDKLEADLIPVLTGESDLRVLRAL